MIGNLDTPLIMAVLSKGQGGTAETVKSEDSLRPPQSWSEAAVMSAHFVSALLLLSCVAPVWTNVDEEAKIFLDQFNTEAVPIIYASSLASWAYNTNITDENAGKMVRIQAAISNQG